MGLLFEKLCCKGKNKRHPLSELVFAKTKIFYLQNYSCGPVLTNQPNKDILGSFNFSIVKFSIYLGTTDDIRVAFYFFCHSSVRNNRSETGKLSKDNWAVEGGLFLSILIQMVWIINVCHKRTIDRTVYRKNKRFKKQLLYKFKQTYNIHTIHT